MADFIARFVAQDNLSPTIKQMAKTVDGFSSTATGLDRVREKFEQIEKANIPLYKKLRSVKDLMADLNISGDSNSPLYNQMAQAAGRYADAIGDARAATNRFASDTMNLQAGIAALQGFAAAGSIATGVMGLFGTKNEEVERAILKVQSALAILNGVQSIANILNKDSVLMQKLKQIRISATTAATKGHTAALATNTAAEKINSAGIKRSTGIQNAWNVAKAISKALLGDFTGLLIVGAAGLAAYSMFTSKSTDELEKNNREKEKANLTTDKLTESYNNYKNTISQSVGVIEGKFKLLQKQYVSLQTEQEKLDWINKQSKEGWNGLALSINSVNDANKAFIDNSAEVINALKKQAELVGRKSYIEELSTQKYKSRDEIEAKYNEMTYDGPKAGDKILKKDFAKYGIKSDEYLYHTLTYDEFNALRNKWAESIQKQREQELSDSNELFDKRITNEINSFIEESNAADDAANKVKDLIKQNGTNTTNTTSTAKPKTDLDIYKNYETLAKNIESRYKVGLISEDEAKKELEKINNDIKAKFGDKVKLIEIDLGLKSDLNIYSEFESVFKDIQQRYKLNLISEEDANKQIQTLNNKLREKLGNQVKEFKLEIKHTIEDGSLSQVNNEITELQNRLNNMNITLNPTLYQQYMQQLIELLDKKYELEKSLTIENEPTISYDEPTRFTRGSNEDKRRSYENSMSKINQIGSDLKMGIINYDDAKNQVQDICDRLKNELGIDLKVKIDKDGNITTLKSELGDLSDIVGGIGTAFNGLGQAMQNAAGQNEALAKSALVASAIGQLAVSFAGAMKGTFTPWDWIAGAVSGVAVLTSVVSQLQSFADGGVVNGSSFIGDHLLARVNSGEMILNGRQQDNLFKAIDNNRLGGNNLAGKVEFEIDGRVIKGVLNNYDSKMKKIK